MRVLKAKTCRQCGEEYEPRGVMQSACSLECVLVQSRAKRASRAAVEIKRAEKADRAALRVRKDKIKPRGEWLKQAQQAFNAYIRERDRGRACISSGRPEQERFTGGHFDAGHYRSTGSAGHLRFNTFNCHAQSKHDNRDLSGNIVQYRPRLIHKIGLERVERLECDNSIRKFDIEYLKRIKAIFTRRKRHIIKLRGLALP